MRLISPLKGFSRGSRWGPRESFRLPNGQWTLNFHYGDDWPAPEGTPIYAPMDGKVTFRGWDNSGYGGGNQVRITNGKYSWWALHLRDPALVRDGQKVKRGDLIGYVGTTGASTGPHLHEEFHINGVPVNPSPYYSAPAPTPTPRAEGIFGMTKHLGPFNHKADQVIPGDDKWRTLRIQKGRSYITQGPSAAVGVAGVNIRGFEGDGARIQVRIVRAGFKSGEGRVLRGRTISVTSQRNPGFWQAILPFSYRVNQWFQAGFRTRTYIDIRHNQDTPIVVEFTRVEGNHS